LWQKEAFAVMDMAEDSQDTQSAIDLLKTPAASANDDIEVNRFFLYYLQNVDDLFPVFCFFFSRMLFLWPFLVCFSSLRRTNSQNINVLHHLHCGKL
jgi:hypothetical protein